MRKFVSFHILKGGVKKTALLRNILYKMSLLKKAILIYFDIKSNLTNLFFKENTEYELLYYFKKQIVIKAIKQIKEEKLRIIDTKSQDNILRNYAETKSFQKQSVFENI